MGGPDLVCFKWDHPEPCISVVVSAKLEIFPYSCISIQLTPLLKHVTQNFLVKRTPSKQCIKLLIGLMVNDLKIKDCPTFCHCKVLVKFVLKLCSGSRFH